MHSHVEKLSSPVSPLTPFLELQCYLFPSMVPVKLRQVCVTFFTMVTLERSRLAGLASFMCSMTTQVFFHSQKRDE